MFRPCQEPQQQMHERAHHAAGACVALRRTTVEMGLTAKERMMSRRPGSTLATTSVSVFSRSSSQVGPSQGIIDATLTFEHVLPLDNRTRTFHPNVTPTSTFEHFNFGLREACVADF